MAHPISLRRLLVAVIACLTAQSASGQGEAAQKIAFHGIPWGISADAVGPRLEPLGFTFSRTLEGGSVLFSRADGAYLTVYLADGRLVGFGLREASRGQGAQARYRRLTDSVANAHFPPDEIMEEEDHAMERLWVVGLASVSIEVRRIGTDGYVDVVWRGPGWYDFMARTAERPELPAGFTTVEMSQMIRIAVDTTVRTPRGAGALRGRFRIEYPVAVTPAANGGVQEAPFDAVEYEMDFNCEEGTTRLLGRATFLEGRRLAENRPRTQSWTVPRRDGHYQRGLEAVCRVARGR